MNEGDSVVVAGQALRRDGVGVAHITILSVAVVIVQCAAENAFSFTIYKSIIGHAVVCRSLAIGDVLIVGGDGQRSLAYGESSGVRRGQLVVARLCAGKSGRCGSIAFTCVGLLARYGNYYSVIVYQVCRRSGGLVALSVIGEAEVRPIKSDFLLLDGQGAVIETNIVVVACGESTFRDVVWSRVGLLIHLAGKCACQGIAANKTRYRVGESRGRITVNYALSVSRYGYRFLCNLNFDILRYAVLVVVVQHSVVVPHIVGSGVCGGGDRVAIRLSGCGFAAEGVAQFAARRRSAGGDQFLRGAVVGQSRYCRRRGCNVRGRSVDCHSHFLGRLCVVARNSRRRYDDVGFAVVQRNRFDRQHSGRGIHGNVLLAAGLDSVTDWAVIRFCHGGADALVSLAVGDFHIFGSDGLRRQGADGHSDRRGKRLIITGLRNRDIDLHGFRCVRFIADGQNAAIQGAVVPTAADLVADWAGHAGRHLNIVRQIDGVLNLDRCCVDDGGRVCGLADIYGHIHIALAVVVVGIIWREVCLDGVRAGVANAVSGGLPCPGAGGVALGIGQRHIL